MDTHDPIPEKLMAKIRVMSERDDLREIPGFSHYVITVDGQVWSVKPHGRSTRLAKTPRRIKTKIWKGYEVLALSQDGITYYFSVGKLLLMAFISPPPFEGAWASFKDGNPLNLSLDNLMWSDSSDAHKRGVDRHGGAFTYGEALKHSKLTPELVEQMRRDYEAGDTQQQIAKKYGVGRRTAGRAIRGEYWKEVDTPIPTNTNVRKGERVNLAKLTEDDVRHIRQLLNQGCTVTAVAKMTGMGTTAISCIKNGHTWKHVK